MKTANSAHGSPLRRQRLLDPFAEARGWAGVQAPFGFGKSVLARQLVESSPGGVVIDASVHGHDPQFDLAAHWVESGEPAVYVVDDFTVSMAPQLEQWGATSAPIVIVGPDLSTASRDLDPLVEAVDLLFTVEEAERLAAQAGSDIPADVLAHVLISQTGGWPLHMVEALAATSRPAEPGVEIVGLLQNHPRIERLVTIAMRSASEETVGQLRQLSVLDSFPEDAAIALLGRCGYESACQGGLPFLHQPDGWLTFVPLIKDWLSREARLQPETARLLAPLLVAKGGVFQAGKILMRAGAAAEAVEVLCAVSETYLDTVNQSEANAMFRILRANAPDNAPLALRHARVSRNLAQFEQQAKAIDDAIELASRHGEEAVLRAATAERLHLSLPQLDPEEARLRISELEQSLGRDEVSRSVKLRCQEIRALLLAQSKELRDINRSVSLLEEVSLEWEHLGDRARAASTLRLLAAGPLNHLGDYADAIQHLERARRLLPDHVFSRALTTELLSRFHALVGDGPSFEATFAEASAFAATIKLTWLTSYLHWVGMLGAVINDDLDMAVRHHLNAEANLGELLHHDTGVVFLTESAGVLAVLGDHERARNLLERARERRAENELEVRLAEVIVGCRADVDCDADAVGSGFDAGRALLADHSVPQGRRWRVLVEMIFAVSRRSVAPAVADGSPVDVDTERLERELHRESEQLGPTGSYEHLLAPQSLGLSEVRLPGLNVRLLGKFAISRYDEELDPPKGQPGMLLKILAVHGEPIPVDRIIDEIWPDADLDVGKRRLKNVVRRLRAAFDDDRIVVRTADTISIGDQVRTDIEEFRAISRRASQSASTGTALATASAIQALSLYDGDLLAADAYADWAIEERQALRARAASLFEFVLESPSRQLAPPVWMLETAIRLRVTSERTYVRIAVSAVAQGSVETARSALAHAQSIADELGVELVGLAGLEDLVA